MRNAGGVRASQKVRFARGSHWAASSSDLTSLSWVSTARSSPTSMANDLLLAGDQGHAPIFQASPRATMWSAWTSDGSLSGNLLRAYPAQVPTVLRRDSLTASLYAVAFG